MCFFLKKEVHYLGHVISSEGVSTDPGKVEAVAQWPRPGAREGVLCWGGGGVVNFCI